MKTSLPLFLFFAIVWFDLQLCFIDGANEEFKACGVYYNCGNLVNIWYSFWGNERQNFCGWREFGLSCKNNETTTIQINSRQYNVLNTSQPDDRMTIGRSELFDDYCPNNESMAMLDFSLFSYSSNNQNLSLWYNCLPLVKVPPDLTFECGWEGEERSGRVNYALEKNEAKNWSSYMGDCSMNIEVTITGEVLREGVKNRTRVMERVLKDDFFYEWPFYSSPDKKWSTILNSTKYCYGLKSAVPSGVIDLPLNLVRASKDHSQHISHLSDNQCKEYICLYTLTCDGCEEYDGLDGTSAPNQFADPLLPLDPNWKILSQHDCPQEEKNWQVLSQHDCPQEEKNWEYYEFGWGSKQGWWSNVSETSGQTGELEMMVKGTAVMKVSEGGIKKDLTVPFGEFGRGWFSFTDMNQNLTECSPYMLEIANKDSKEGRKNKLGLLEKAIASDDSMIDKRFGHYIRYEEVEGLTFKRKTNRMSLLEKPATRTKQELDVEFKDLYTIACDACRETHGKCGKNATYLFYCICETQDQHCHHVYTVSPRPGKSNLLKKIFIIVAIASGSIILTISIIIFIYSTRKHILDDKKIEEMIRRYSTHTPKRYSYSQLKKITNSFANKLGQGGFGTVYKGKLRDGQDVAVKILNESRENGQDFMNEVVSVTKTSHVNIATLLGFCYERSRRALVYEYMSNGSLNKYIFQRGLQIKNDVDLSLDAHTLYSIVIGVGRGLEYLHCHCNTRILHFDIKPDNILLDNNFCPKISDFGLAKQCMAKESYVSMTGMKGTIGFMAPEVIFRNLGKVSHKSDVYSYGMLVLEMLGEKKCPNEGTGQSSEEYFPDWIYNKLTRHEIDGGCYSWGDAKEEEEMARKMIIVGLHCIQTLPDNRPSMTNVVSMLEGSVDVLQIPPKPNLFGPPATDLLQGAAAASSSNSY